MTVYHAPTRPYFISKSVRGCSSIFTRVIPKVARACTPRLLSRPISGRRDCPNHLHGRGAMLEAVRATSDRTVLEKDHTWAPPRFNCRPLRDRKREALPAGGHLLASDVRQA